MFFENTSATRIASDHQTFRLGTVDEAVALFVAATCDGRWCLYQVPTRARSTIPMSAVRENHAMLPCPRGSTMKAASSGPSAEPALPPTWKNDCANPCRPPEAMRATRDDSGWKIEDPIPTQATA